MVNKSTHNKKIKKHNHWVPRFYLKHFSIRGTENTKNPQVWCFSNKDGEPFKTSTRQIANKNYLYAPKNKNGTRSQDAEDLLSNIESFISRIWLDLATKKVNFSDVHIKRVLSIFIASLYLRNIKKLDDHIEYKKQFIEAIESFPVDDNGNPMIEEIQFKNESIVFDPSSFHVFKNDTSDFTQDIFVDSIFEHTFPLVELLINKKWTIISSKNSSFITTDAPVVFYNSNQQDSKISTFGTKIIFPLSPRFILMLHDENHLIDGQYYSAEDPEVFNSILWMNSYEFMFSPRLIDNVLFEMNYIIEEINNCT